MTPPGLGMGLALPLSGMGGIARPPFGPIPDDAYIEPEGQDDEGYWRTASQGYYQQPEE